MASTSPNSDVSAIAHSQEQQPIMVDGTVVMGNALQSEFGDVEANRQSTYKQELDEQVAQRDLA